jgi:hypothetical protein
VTVSKNHNFIINSEWAQESLTRQDRRNINMRSKHLVLRHVILSVDVHTECFRHGNFPSFLMFTISRDIILVFPLISTLLSWLP